MTLLSKIVFNLKPVKDENIFEVERDCASHFGELLSMALRENTKRNAERELKLPFKLELSSYGKGITFNTNSIVYESEWYFTEDNSDDLGVQCVASFIMDSGLDINKDMKSSFKKIVGLIGEDVEVSVKVLKIGNNDYSCYTVGSI